jgi:uncharacterized membrane protein
MNIDQQCPVSLAFPYSRFLILAAVGYASAARDRISASFLTPFRHFACCLGDTLASELGILSPTRPILITTLRPVPPGTNGAMSLVGTAVSFLGGAVIGLSFAVTLFIQSSACRAHPWSLLSEMCGWGFASGGIGSLVGGCITLEYPRVLTVSAGFSHGSDDSANTLFQEFEKDSPRRHCC